MFKFSLSVRAYHTGRLYGLPCWEEWKALPAETMQAACLRAADEVLAHGRGKRTAIELYRAAGLGVYNIAWRMIDAHAGLPLRQVRMICNQVDTRLHDSLD